MFAFLKLLNYKKIAEIIIVVVVAIALFAAYEHWRGPNVIVRNVPGEGKVVYVDKPVLTPGTVTPYVPEITKAEVQKLLAEQTALKNEVITLNATIAKLQTSGEGKVVYVDRPVPGTTQVEHTMSFKDWRLTFNAVDDKATYSLDQKFAVVATSGRTLKGLPTTSVKLFEVGPGDKMTPATNVEVTSVVANPTGEHWFLSPSVQAGFAATWDTNARNFNGGVVGLQWLKRGYTEAAEDSVWSIGTPVVFFSASSVKLGVLPVSVNLGRLPKQPFKDLWLSPLVTMNGAGIVLTATF